MHLCVADERISNVETAERKARAGATDVPAWIASIEGTSETCVESAAKLLAEELAGVITAMPACIRAVYALQHTRSDSD